MRIALLLILMPWLLLAEEVEIALRNPLDLQLSDRLVVIRLADFGVQEEQPIQAIEVTDETGRSVPSQFDPFGRFSEASSEVVVKLDLAPSQQRLLHLVIQRGPWPNPPTIPIDEGHGTLELKNMTYTFSRYSTYGLRIEQPQLNGAAQREAGPDVEGLLDGLLEAPATGPQHAAPPPVMEPPLRAKGLPFCLLGLSGFSEKAQLLAWNGPLRATLSLIDGLGRQTFWFPKQAQQVFFDAFVHWPESRDRLVMTAGGLQLNSQDHKWIVTMGQRGKPPYTAPVTVQLSGSRHTPYLEGYQRSSFNQRWAVGTSKAGSVGTVADRLGSDLGASIDWNSGQKLLANQLAIDDPGPSGISLSYSLRDKELPADYHAQLHLIFPFSKDPLNLDDAWVERFTAPLVVRPVTTQDHPPVASLPAGLKPVVIVPDRDPRIQLWDRLALGLNAAWQRSSSMQQYVNVLRSSAEGDLLVVAGYPGCGGVFDQLNSESGIINAYPWSDHRHRLTLLPANETRGPILMIAASHPEALPAAIDAALALTPPAQPRPPLLLSQRPWVGYMPYPWEGTHDAAGPFHALAYAGAQADFLLLVRAETALDNLRLQAPPTAAVSWVKWVYQSPTDLGVRPVNDAAKPLADNPLPALKPGDLLGLWVRLPAETNSPQSCQLTWNGGKRSFQLEVETLQVPVAGQALGFYPLGFGKESIMPYFGWDEATYYTHLPDLIRQAKSFGISGFSFDIKGIRLELDAQGELTVNVDGLRREIEAVRQAGWVDFPEIHSPNLIWQRDRAVFTELVRRHNLPDDWAAWELIIPKLHAALEELGVADELICRHADEIPDFERWLGYAEIYQRCGFRMTVAINGYGVANHRLGVGVMGAWMPLYNFYLNRWGKPIAEDAPDMFNRHFRDERQAAGEPIWPYVCGPGPYAWSPRPRSQIRWLMMDVHRKGAQGLAYYGGMVWSHTLDPKYRKSEIADLFAVDATFTTLFYPDREHERLLPSLRAISAQQGLDDAAALTTIRQLAKERGTSAEAELDAAFDKLDMNSDQPAFDTYRRTLNNLWTNLQE